MGVLTGLPNRKRAWVPAKLYGMPVPALKSKMSLDNSKVNGCLNHVPCPILYMLILYIVRDVVSCSVRCAIWQISIHSLHANPHFAFISSLMYVWVSRFQLLTAIICVPFRLSYVKCKNFSRFLCEQVVPLYSTHVMIPLIMRISATPWNKHPCSIGITRQYVVHNRIYGLCISHLLSTSANVYANVAMVFPWMWYSHRLVFQYALLELIYKEYCGFNASDGSIPCQYPFLQCPWFHISKYLWESCGPRLALLWDWCGTQLWIPKPFQTGHAWCSCVIQNVEYPCSWCVLANILTTNLKVANRRPFVGAQQVNLIWGQNCV